MSALALDLGWWLLIAFALVWPITLWLDRAGDAEAARFERERRNYGRNR